MMTIRELRHSRGLTQVQLGRMLGCSGTMVYCWEKGTHRPTLRYAYQIAQIFNVPMGTFDYHGRLDTETGARVDPQAPVTMDRIQQSGEDINGPDY